ncbi:hypothetical protein An11g01780 [Aspergillus niger]|uniref:Uncharacterized protein n=2 Tax=Aspergillus niger TaxID=5061 RepID=A2QVK8_ASPNC|nr:hypothetical protein An11g01780 [Aspergillus niger]CAK45912.1 hypothetical protein An11g01780 [Aspergillus niger]
MWSGGRSKFPTLRAAEQEKKVRVRSKRREKKKAAISPGWSDLWARMTVRFCAAARWRGAPSPARSLSVLSPGVGTGGSQSHEKVINYRQTGKWRTVPEQQ